MRDKSTIEECRDLAPRAYAPYSGFHVAAVVLTDGGSAYRGVNLENASYGITMCAEVGALMAANLSGDFANIRAIYVAGGTINASGHLEGDKIVTPCGRCRQIIYEAASLRGADIDVICVSGDGLTELRSSIRELLPHGFGPQTLDKRVD